MELTERQKLILAEIVRIYIETGEPVGSKMLTDCPELNISSATVRNEMSELSEKGFIDQPHTSAGRIPTDLGYRLYVDSLMHRHILTSEDIRQIDSMLPSSVSRPEHLLTAVSQAIASLTRCAALSTIPADDGARIKTVQMIPTSRYSAILVLLTTGGIMRSSLTKTIAELTPEVIEYFANFAKSEIIGYPLSRFQPALIQNMAAAMDEMSLALTPVISLLAEMIKDAGEADLQLQGQENLLSHQEFRNGRAEELLRFLGHPDRILQVLRKSEIPLNIIIGGDGEISELFPSSLITADYRYSEEKSGHIGVIGPTRMPYERIIPSLEYISTVVGRLMSELIDEND